MLLSQVLNSEPLPCARARMQKLYRNIKRNDLWNYPDLSLNVSFSTFILVSDLQYGHNKISLLKYM